LIVVGLLGCAPLGMTLPTDELTPPTPDGAKIKPTLGWLTTQPGQTTTGAPEGSIAIQVVKMGGHSLLQQVRHYRIGQAAYGDSILLDRVSLKPQETFRWTPAGTYIARYNHRVIERTFQPVKGSAVHSTETLDVEPYSALGMELIVASLPLMQGFTSILPFAIDTASRGWAWMRITVQAEESMQERPDQKGFDTFIVDCANGPGATGIERTRLYIAVDGRSVRKILHLGAENEVLGTLRRMLLSIPTPSKSTGL